MLEIFNEAYLKISCIVKMQIYYANKLRKFKYAIYLGKDLSPGCSQLSLVLFISQIFPFH